MFQSENGANAKDNYKLSYRLNGNHVLVSVFSISSFFVMPCDTQLVFTGKSISQRNGEK